MRLAPRVVACALVGLLAACSGSPTVTPPPPGNFPSVVTISPRGDVSGVLYRIGTGAWTAGALHTTTQFTVPVGTTTYSVAFACSGPYENDQTVVNLAVTDTLVVPAVCAGDALPLYIVAPSIVSGTFDATAVGATSALVSATLDHAHISVASAAGSYANLVTDYGHQTYVVAGKNGAGDFVGFKTLHGVLAGFNAQTINFPTMTTADAAVPEPLTVTGATGSQNAIGVAYLLDGTDNGFYVTRAGHTTYSGLPAADWAASDSYGVFAESFDTIGNDQFGTLHLGRTAATAPVAVMLPTLGHIAISHADLSLPLTYAGLSSSDVAKGYLLAEFDGPTPPEYDIATPAFLAGKSSYGPPSFVGQSGFVTKTVANVTTAEYGIMGFSFQPSPISTTYLGGFPPPGQSVEAYLSVYSPSAAPGSRLRLMQRDRVPVGVFQP